MADEENAHTDIQVLTENNHNGCSEPGTVATRTISDDESAIDAQTTPTPLPKLQIFLVLLIQFAEPITGLVIYPFVNQFVRDTGITKGDDRRTGYYAGIIESAFFFAEAATAIQWGWLSDRIGRRPVLLLGPLGLTFAMLRFGYSTSYWPLVWSRCLQGVFNGNIGVTKTVMVELTDETNIGDAFALTPLVWSIGSTSAPIIGGVLSNPATRWPHIFGKITVFRDHPYFLPCVVSATVAFSSFVISFLGFKETLASIVTNHKSEYQKPKPSLTTPEADPTDALLGHGNDVDYGTVNSTRCGSPTTSETSIDSCGKLVNASSDPPTLRSVLRSRTLKTTILNYILLTFTEMCYSALLPLIYSTPIELGGLGLKPYAIGLTMGTWGFVNAVVQINFLGRFIRKYGASRVYQISYACFVVCFATYPVSTYLARRDDAIGVGTRISIFVQLLFQLGIYMSYGAIHVIVAETTPKPVLGAINGIVQMSGCVMRTIAPTFASSLFSISLQKHLAGGNLVYIVLLAVAFVGVRCSLFLPERKRKAASH